MGGTAPGSLCLGGELLIPLRGAALRSPAVNQKSTRRKHTLPQLTPGQGHDRLARNSSPPLTATDYWWSGLHWTAKVDHSQSATNMRRIETRRGSKRNQRGLRDQKEKATLLENFRTSVDHFRRASYGNFSKASKNEGEQKKRSRLAAFHQNLMVFLRLARRPARFD